LGDIRNTFGKAERLCSKKLIGELFKDGKHITIFPYRLIWKEVELPSSSPVQIAISVPKKRMKRAVDRNRIKRVLREGYRLNKAELYNSLKDSKKQYALFLIYSGPKDIEFKEAEGKIILILQRLIKECGIVS
jgi:ribonuclease P protein component